MAVVPYIMPGFALAKAAARAYAANPAVEGLNLLTPRIFTSAASAAEPHGRTNAQVRRPAPHPHRESPTMTYNHPNCGNARGSHWPPALVCDKTRSR